MPGVPMFLFVLFACTSPEGRSPGDPEADTDTDSDTDTDTDTDSDTDTDTDTDSDTEPAARWTGESRPANGDIVVGLPRSSSMGGYALASGADLDGDGTTDLVIGAPGAETAGNDAGAAFVEFGPVDADRVAGDGFVVEAEDEGACVGAVVAAGDVDGDGADDLLVAEPDALQDGIGNERGRVYLFRGPLSPTTVSVAEADATFEGEGGPDAAGNGVAVFPDQGGDGLPELVIGVPFDGSRGANAGALYLFSGGGVGEVALADADVRIFGDGGQGFGRGARAVSDLDGDGVGDVVAAASGYRDGSYTGAVLVFSGPLSAGLASDADAVITGADAGLGYFLQSTADVGDVDGDGVADLVVGSWAYTVGGAQGAGAAWLVSGAGLSGVTDLLFASATIQGDSADDQLGRVLTGGDLDGDGRGDLAVSAPTSNEYASNAGSVHLYYGPFSGSLGVADADASFYGNASSEALGLATAAGDLTGDGVLDLLMGATGIDYDAENAGGVYVVAGAPGR